MIYEFAAKYINTPERIFRDKVNIYSKIGPKQKHTGMLQLSQLIDDMWDKKNRIKGELAKIATGIRGGTDATGAVRGKVVGMGLVSSDNLAKGPNIAQKLIMKAVIIPQIKLFTFFECQLGVMENPCGGGLWRLDLILSHLVSGGHTVLASSQAKPAQSKGMKLVANRASK